MNMKKRTNNEGFMINNKRIIGAILVIIFLIIFNIVWGIVEKATHTAHAEPTNITPTEASTTMVETTATSVVETTTTATSTTLAVTSTTMTETTTLDTTNVPTTTEVFEVINEQPVEEHHEEVAKQEEPTKVETRSVVTTSPVITTSTEATTTTTATTTTVVETTTTAMETEPETNVTESEVEEVFLGNFRITGYVAGAGAKTASGTTPSASRTIAMNKTQFKNMGLKWGDKIRIDGVGTFILEDCGCKSGVIDVFRNSVSACYELPPYADAYLVKE